VRKVEDCENVKGELARMFALFLLFPHHALVATVGEDPKLDGTRGL